MNKELTQRLVERFPVLYQNFYESPQNTCMCWGFDHGDGWEPIIWQLSLAIEEELGYSKTQKWWFLFKKRIFKRWNNFIYKLSPPVHDKIQLVKGEDNVYRQVVTEKMYPRDQWLKDLFVRILPDSSDNFSSRIGSIQRLGLKCLVVHPNTGFAVDQVKEKFGTLRFYCPGNDRIYKYVHMAEELSALMCEVCGKPAKLESPSGWYSTVCKDHSRTESE
jgi:hypothetical protein